MNQAEIERKILAFWKENNTFRKSVEKRAPHGDFVFYDGPPFATGTPHYGHIVASLMKDMVPRYWTMRGYRVERRWGWDCHGLPIENIVEKEHGFKHKKDILAYGVDKFNEDARGKVLVYAKEWREVIERLGRWVDMDNSAPGGPASGGDGGYPIGAYKTMDWEYMESIWWAFKQLYDKGLLYEAYRSMHICPRCETTLAQSEVAQGYKDVQDLSVVAKFKIKSDPNDPNYIRMTRMITRHPERSEAESRDLREYPMYLLAWTTTPWTLPGNAALAVGEDIKYVLVRHPERSEAESRDPFVVAKDRIKDIFKDTELEIIKELKGKDLVGLSYEPLFPYYDNDKTENHKNGFKVYAAPFVNTEEGTGIVHIAPAFGEDDMNLGKEKNLPFIQHVNTDGTFKKEVTDFAGEFVKHQDAPATEDHPETKTESMDVKIIKYLAAKNLLFSKAKYTHSYPHCWRCDSPLLNYAASSWFVDVTKIKAKLLKQAENINWVPSHMKEGRFGNWLQGARDWSVSRQRFWGSVLPIWKSDDGKEIKVIGSIDELREQTDAKITKIIFVRHAESEKNIKHIHSSALDKHPLTKEGERQVKNLAKMFSGEKVDVIISSPILRARSTAEAVAKKLGLKIKFDDRLLEDNNGEWEEKNQKERCQEKSYQDYLSSPLEKKFEFKMGGGESAKEICWRVEDFVKSIARDFSGKTVLVVSHGIISAAFDKILNKGSLEKFYYLCDATPFARPQPYYLNPDGSGFDLHKHHIDKITLRGQGGQELKRIPDVLDCWFESGSMPFAQSHYPFENNSGRGGHFRFPAQFIAEGVDQTRAWFYYLHVLSVALQGRESFRNVVVNGIVLAENGQKMSKRLKNYPDPMEMFEKYGADAVRYYLACAPVLRAEDLNFSEKGVEEAVKKVILILYNVLAFYKMYETRHPEPVEGYNNSDAKTLYPSTPLRVACPEYARGAQDDGSHVLDQWIMAKTNKLISDITAAYEKYDLNKAARPIAEFINELSTWYLRRSRERLKEGDREALSTLCWVLERLSLIMAPVMPFTAEYVWQEVQNQCHSEPALGGRNPLNSGDGKDKGSLHSPAEYGGLGRDDNYADSVHLQEWPKAGKVDTEILEEMETVRHIVEAGLSLRADMKIKVRQPLLSGNVTISKRLSSGSIELIKDELNVKEFNINILDSSKIGGTLLVELDGSITPELQTEGHLRELIRTINGMRKNKGLTPGDTIILTYNTESTELKTVFEKFGDELKKSVIAKEIVEKKNSAEVIDINGEKISLVIEV